MSSALSLLTVATLLTATVPDAALPSAQQATDAPRLQALEMNWTREGLITGVGGALWITTEAFIKDRLAPAHCRWCDCAADGADTLNGFDRWGRGVAARTPEGRHTWSTWSNVVDFGVLPVGVLGAQYLLASGSGAPVRYFAEDATIIVESAVVAAVVNQAVKFTVGRERPFVHVLEDGQKANTDNPLDNNVSFYSGHTSLAFSLVTAAGTVSELRGYDKSWLIWAVGLPAAASVGLMRMGADKHYLSDVLVGAAAGSLFGVGVPLLLHGRTPAATDSAAPSMRLSGNLGGMMLSGQF